MSVQVVNVVREDFIKTIGDLSEYASDRQDPELADLLATIRMSARMGQECANGTLTLMLATDVFDHAVGAAIDYAQDLGDTELVTRAEVLSKAVSLSAGSDRFQCGRCEYFTQDRDINRFLREVEIHARVHPAT